MSSHAYRGDEDIVYPSLGFLAEPGQSYEIPDGVDVPADGRWDSTAPAPAPEQPAPVPEPAGELPSPEPGAEPTPEAAPEPTTIGD